MRVDVRPVSRLRGTDPVDVTAALGPVIEALCASDVDLSRLTVVCDWIQYRSSFREVADYRPVLGPGRAADVADQGDVRVVDCHCHIFLIRERGGLDSRDGLGGQLQRHK